MKQFLKTGIMILVVLLAAGCRDQVYNELTLDKETSPVQDNEELEGYVNLGNGIYLSESLSLSEHPQPDYYTVVDLNPDTVAHSISELMDTNYTIDEKIIDTHSQHIFNFGDSLGRGQMSADVDYRLYIELIFNQGDKLYSVLSNPTDHSTDEEFSFKSRDNIGQESVELLKSMTGMDDFLVDVQSIPQEAIQEVSDDVNEMAQEVGRSSLDLNPTDIYYVRLIPMIKEYEIMSFNFLGRGDDWSTFNPGAEIELIYSHFGLEHAFIRSLFIPGEPFKVNREQTMHKEDVVAEIRNRWTERIQSESVFIESIDYVYISYVPDLEVMERVYKPYWRVGTFDSEGQLLEVNYFDPETGSEYR